MNQQQVSSNNYQGWGQISQVGFKELYLTFPLNEQKTYLITSSDDSDLTLPPNLQNVKILIHVDKTVIIENATSPSVTNTVTLNDKKLNSGEKIIVPENSTINIGLLHLAYKRTEAPGLSQLQVLFSNLKCSICLRFLENPRILPCQHIFCQSCISSFLRPPVIQLSGSDQPLQADEHQSIASSCPVCRKSLPKGENGRPQAILSDISKMFKEMLDGRPLCAMCSNQRWIMHGSDYLFCEKCQKLYCPLCALECHRHHKLRNKYALALEVSRQFCNKLVQAKQDWMNALKEAEEYKVNVRKAILRVEMLKSQLKKFDQSMDDEIKPTILVYNKVQTLTVPRVDSKIESDRRDTLQNLVTHVNTYRSYLNNMTETLNTKLSVVNRAQRIEREESSLSQSKPSKSLSSSSVSSSGSLGQP